MECAVHNYFGDCSECVLVVAALVIVMWILIYYFYKYAVYKDKQILKIKKKGK